MYYHFKIHRQKSGYWAECIELSGCVTQANTRATLKTNMEEALNLYLDEPADSKAISALPRRVMPGKNIVRVQVEASVAFSFLLRQLRMKKKMTQKQVAQSLGLKNLYSYQRLESSKTANPSLATLVDLKSIFPELSLDQVSD